MVGTGAYLSNGVLRTNEKMFSVTTYYSVRTPASMEMT
jgi:hypothetical protein